MTELAGWLGADSQCNGNYVWRWAAATEFLLARDTHDRIALQLQEPRIFCVLCLFWLGFCSQTHGLPHTSGLLLLALERRSYKF